MVVFLKDCGTVVVLKAGVAQRSELQFSKLVTRVRLPSPAHIIIKVIIVIMFQLVIFDFDGTIADTLEDTIKFFNEIATKYGFRKIDPDRDQNLRQLGARELIKKFKVPARKLLALSREIRLKLNKDIQHTPLIKEMDQLIKDLATKGVKIGIVTSNSTENVQLFINHWQLKNIDFVYSRDSLFGKDKVLKRVIRQQKFAKKDVIYVGDEVRDIEAAHKAGIAVIAVTWGFNSKQRLQQANPDHLVSSPEEILAKLNI